MGNINSSSLNRSLSSNEIDIESFQGKYSQVFCTARLTSHQPSNICPFSCEQSQFCLPFLHWQGWFWQSMARGTQKRARILCLEGDEQGENHNQA